MPTEFTKEWLKEPRNQGIISKARELTRLPDTPNKNFGLFFLFKKVESLDMIWVQKDLEKQGWTKSAIRKYLSSDLLISFKDNDIYLAEAVIEAALTMPNGAAKTKIFMRKLCR